MRAIFERGVVAQLRRDLRRIEWIGELAPIPGDRPLVIYANHQAFYDGLVLGFLARRVLERNPCVWMEEFHRLPAAGWLGAMAFPPDDVRRRAATMRATIARLRHDPRTTFIYFPEGRLHPFEEEILPFSPDDFVRLARVLPPCSWWPLGVKVWTWNTARPVATLVGGAVELEPPPNPRARLSALRQRLIEHCARVEDEPSPTTLLDGRPGPDERWAWLARLLPGGTAR